jgi:hypothetical protein
MFGLHEIGSLLRLVASSCQQNSRGPHKPDNCLLVRKRTIPTKWPLLVGEVDATFYGRRCRNWSLRPLISGFQTVSRYLSFKSLLSYPHEAEWTPFQIQYISENLVAPGIEPGASWSVSGGQNWFWFIMLIIESKFGACFQFWYLSSGDIWAVSLTRVFESEFQTPMGWCNIDHSNCQNVW